MYEASAPSLSYSLCDAHPVRQSVRQLVDMLQNNYRGRFLPLFVLETHKIRETMPTWQQQSWSLAQPGTWVILPGSDFIFPSCPSLHSRGGCFSLEVLLYS